MKSTNQLHNGAHNVVFYPRVYAQCHGLKAQYYDIDQYKPFRDILFIKNGLESSAYVDKPLPDKVCYKNAVFSQDLFLNQASHAISYFKESMNVKDEKCTHNILVIINRSNYRRILNVSRLLEISKDMGYDAREVFMEKLTMNEQTQLIHCTSILIGVTGAGMQWAYFMRNDSGVIEIAWPHKEWAFFFTGKGGNLYSLHHLINVKINMQRTI